MAPSAQAGGGRGQAPAAGIRHGIRAVLLGPPGAGKGTQVRAMRTGTAGGTGPPGLPHCRHSACDPRVEGRGCPAFLCPEGSGCALCSCGSGLPYGKYPASRGPLAGALCPGSLCPGLGPAAGTRCPEHRGSVPGPATCWPVNDCPAAARGGRGPTGVAILSLRGPISPLSSSAGPEAGRDLLRVPPGYRRHAAGHGGLGLRAGQAAQGDDGFREAGAS